MRVSEILGALGMVDPWWFTPESRERGHFVHYIAQHVFARQDVSVAPEFDGYKTALENALAALPGIVFIHIEVRLFHPTRAFNGRPDAIGFLPSRVGNIPAGPVIPDVKSGERLPSHGVQLSLYETLASVPEVRALLPVEFRNHPWTKLGIYVMETGRHKIHVYNNPDDRAAAESALVLTEWRRKHGLIARSSGAQDDQTERAPSDGAAA